MPFAEDQNVPSRWRIASIASEDALILPHARIRPDAIFGNDKSSERQSSHPVTTASGRLKAVTNLELDNKAKPSPTIRKPTLAGCYSVPIDSNIAQITSSWQASEKPEHSTKYAQPRLPARTAIGTSIK